MAGNIKKVLFVCTGNSCRSIMAEAYLRQRASEEGLDIEVRSAGTLGIDGMSPSVEAMRVIEDEGISPEGYSSTAIDEGLIEWADIILVMEPMHRNTVVSMVPDAEGKVRYLGKFIPDREDYSIPDPIGRTMAFYKASFGIIRESIEELIKWLKE